MSDFSSKPEFKFFANKDFVGNYGLQILHISTLILENFNFNFENLIPLFSLIAKNGFILSRKDIT